MLFRSAWEGRFGEHAVVEEDNEMKLYWGWAFGWDRRTAKLAKGRARLALRSTTREPEPRQIDAVVLTTDAAYRPLIKERPRHPSWALADSWRAGFPENFAPLARKTGAFDVPESWKPKTFRDRGFLYLWNADENRWWDPTNSVRVPYMIRDRETAAAFEKKFSGAKEIPIFSDKRIVPVFHGTGPHRALDTASDKPAARADATNILRWLDENPDRMWGSLLNYQPDLALNETARANFLKYRDRFVGRVSG